MMQQASFINMVVYILTGSVKPSSLFPNDWPWLQPIFASILNPLFSEEIDLKHVIRVSAYEFHLTNLLVNRSNLRLFMRILATNSFPPHLRPIRVT